MNFSKPEVKRARPALGTILRLHLWGEDSEPLLEALTDEAFARAEALEKIFSKFRDDSDLNRVNRAPTGRETRVSPEFRGALMLALEVWRTSKGAFTPFANAALVGRSSVVLTRDGVLKISDCTLDLSGIAKGFIVDELADLISGRLPDCSAVIEAGGDLRFVNCTDRPAHIRLASQSLRALHLSQDSVATSALTEWLGNPQSSTVYYDPPVYSADHTVSAIADTCAVADALTKVGWFASKETRLACARHFGAEILVLGADGVRR